MPQNQVSNFKSPVTVTVVAIRPLQPDFRWLVALAVSRGLLAFHRTRAMWRSCGPGPFFRQAATPSRIFLFRVVLAATARHLREPILNLTGARAARERAPSTIAPGSAVAGRAPGRAGQGVAPGSVGQPAGRGCGCHVGAERGGGPGQEEGRQRMLGESDERGATVGTGRRGSPPGVSACPLLSSQRALALQGEPGPTLVSRPRSPLVAASLRPGLWWRRARVFVSGPAGQRLASRLLWKSPGPHPPTFPLLSRGAPETCDKVSCRRPQLASEVRRPSDPCAQRGAVPKGEGRKQTSGLLWLTLVQLGFFVAI